LPLSSPFWVAKLSIIRLATALRYTKTYKSSGEKLDFSMGDYETIVFNAFVGFILLFANLKGKLANISTYVENFVSFVFLNMFAVAHY
jgi:hypothetical protein